jgi:hypothetical protein
MKRYPALIAAGLLTLLTVSEAHAATQNEQEKACRGDAMHFCSAEIPNKEKITACKQHVSELSPPCQAMFKQGGHSSGNAASSTKKQD